MRAMSEIVLSEKNGFRFEFLAFQTARPPYGSNRNFRQALNWLLDREAIQQSVYFDTGSIGYDPFLPGTPFYDPSYRPFTRDLDLYVGRWWGYRPDPDLYLSTLVYSAGSNNYSKYANAELDQLLDGARSDTAAEKRRTLYRQVAAILSEDAANIYYHYGSNFK